MTAPPRLVLATRNPGKLTELRRILAASGLGVDVRGLEEFPGMAEVAETGATFAENALLKAHAVAGFTRLPAVADDSGLCVDALNGMPGVLSARWSGRHGADEENLRLVLAQVADVPAHRRGAHFACAAALVLPSGFSHVEEGAVHGTLTEAPRGTNGFGYDPVFLPAAVPGVPAGLTTAELSSADKDAISHRGQALRRLVPVIADMVR